MSLSLLSILLLLFISCLNGLTMVIRGSRGQVKNEMLGAALFTLSIYFLAHFLWYRAGYILDCPHLMRTVNPLMFLTGPFFYFFVRNSLFDRKGLTKMDFLHFIPACLHVIELIPFYRLDYSTKLKIAEATVNDPQNMDLIAQGLLPTDWVNLVMVLLMTAYFFYSIYILTALKGKWVFPLNRQRIKDWLYVAVVIFGVFNFSYLLYRIFFTFSVFEIGIGTEIIIQVLTVTTLLSIALLNFYVHLRPEYVYPQDTPGGKATGLLGRKKNDDPGDRDKIALHEIPGPEEEKIVRNINSLLQNQQVFRQEGLSVLDLANTLHMTPRVLGAACKRCTGKTTRELINFHRVKYAKEKITSGYLDQYTLDALGKEAGFSSRTTFFNAFKKELGQSPTAFWTDFQKGDI